MKSLGHVQAVLVSDQLGSFELLVVWLRSEGATLRTMSWAEADALDALARPAALLLDMEGRAEAAFALLARLRKAGEEPVLAIGLVERGEHASYDPSAPRLHKLLPKPVHPADVVSALVSLGQVEAPRSARASGAPEGGEEESRALFRRVLKTRAEQRNVRALLAVVNASGPFRFTSILRFDDEQLSSVWTYDREHPERDSFPLDKAVCDSYCGIVRDTGEALEVEDARRDPRVLTHPARLQVLSYCGAPLFQTDGAMYGTLCHFDVAPRAFASTTLQKLKLAAEIVSETLMSTLGGGAVAADARAAER